MLKHKAYKFRLYPTQKQRVLLNKTFGCVRFVWNYNVECFNDNIEIYLRR
nr:MAG TPA: endonuclease [Caudoviricetes sp.]